MRDYMRAWRRERRARAGKKPRKPQERVHWEFGAVDRSKAAYDPLRDGPVRYADDFAELMGEPPIGRRAIDKMKN